MSDRSRSMKLVTIVCEEIATKQLLRIVADSGAHGATLSRASGVGRHGKRAADIGESANVRVEVVCAGEVAECLISAVEREMFRHYACTVWECDVRVRRPEKF